MKREASIDQSAFRLRFAARGALDYQVERVRSCSDPEADGVVVKSGTLIPGKGYVLMSPDRGKGLGIPGLIEELCYDPLRGSGAAGAGSSVSGFAVIPGADLEAGRLDRMSLLVLSGASAEVSFE